MSAALTILSCDLQSQRFADSLTGGREQAESNRPSYIDSVTDDPASSTLKTQVIHTYERFVLTLYNNFKIKFITVSI